MIFFLTACRYDCIESDLLGSLQLGIHNIAPYKSKGIEKASELTVCWVNKANNVDKDLRLHCGTSGKVDSMNSSTSLIRLINRKKFKYGVNCERNRAYTCKHS